MCSRVRPNGRRQRRWLPSMVGPARFPPASPSSSIPPDAELARALPSPVAPVIPRDPRPISELLEHAAEDGELPPECTTRLFEAVYSELRRIAGAASSLPADSDWKTARLWLAREMSG